MIIKLDREEIRAKIAHGDRDNANYILAVAPDGSAHRVVWVEGNRLWDPWPEGWRIISLPALFPAGSDAEYQLARLCLRDHDLDWREIEIQDEVLELGLIGYANKYFPEWMEDARDDALDFLENAFIDACNGDGSELNDPSPWGYEYDEHGNPSKIGPPGAFEYA